MTHDLIVDEVRAFRDELCEAARLRHRRYLHRVAATGGGQRTSACFPVGADTVGADWFERTREGGATGRSIRRASQRRSRLSVDARRQVRGVAPGAPALAGSG